MRHRSNSPVMASTAPDQQQSTRFAPLRRVRLADWVRRSGRLRHIVLFAFAAAVPILGRLLTVGAASDNVVWPHGSSWTLPTFCLSRNLGFECATCGVTRSIIALMHGDLTGSVGFHPFGWLIFTMIIVQIPFRAYRIVYPDRRMARLGSAGYALLITTIAVVLLNYFLRLLAKF